MRTYNLPDPGEGLLEAEIVSWRVQPGQQVKVNDVVLEIETSKSVVELPIPWSGTIVELLAKEGDVVAIGSPVIRLEESADAAPEPEPDGDEPEPKLLVGSGPKESGSRRARRRAAAATPAEEESLAGVADSFGDVHGRGADEVTVPHPIDAEPTGDPLPSPGQVTQSAELVLAGSDPTLAKPPVRKLAKQLGVDLDEVTGTGPRGTITRGDVEAAAAMAALAEQRARLGAQQGMADDFGQDSFSSQSGFGDKAGSGGQSGFSAQPGSNPFTGRASHHGTAGERREPIRGVRRATAQKMVESINTHVHVMEWVTVDVTATMEMVARLKEDRRFANLRVSPLLVYAKAVCLAMANTPEINTSWDEENQEIVHHGQVNLGVAAATPRGLMVPNIKGADSMSLLELCRSINAMVQISREGKLQPADYSGGTFTITNVGVFGVDAGTPIINGNESAILVMGSIDRRPWVMERDGVETIEPRWVTTVSLGFDHRLIDGEQGSKFLRDVADLLSKPETAFLY